MTRLGDIVKGRVSEPVPSGEVKGASPRLGNLFRKQAVAIAAPSRPTVLSRNGETEGPPPDDLDEAGRLLQRAVDIGAEILEAVRGHAAFPISQAREVVESLLQSLEAGDALLFLFFSAKDLSPSPAREAVNVSILSVKMGLELSYADEELRRLGLAALLCDVGMAHVPATILGKQGPLTPDERAVVEKHQREGAKLLHNLGEGYRWLVEVVEKRYERREGQHQPENKVEEYAMIIHLADVYESLVHHRPFRQRVGPREALKEVLKWERTTFPDSILKALIRILSTFPVGSLVRLNTGEIGQVVARNKDFPLRPVVKIVVRRGKRLENPVVIDLRQSPLHYVQDAFVEEAVE